MCLCDCATNSGRRTWPARFCIDVPGEALPGAQSLCLRQLRLPPRTFHLNESRALRWTVDQGLPLLRPPIPGRMGSCLFRTTVPRRTWQRCGIRGQSQGHRHGASCSEWSLRHLCAPHITYVRSAITHRAPRRAPSRRTSPFSRRPAMRRAAEYRVRPVIERTSVVDSGQSFSAASTFSRAAHRQVRSAARSGSARVRPARCRPRDRPLEDFLAGFAAGQDTHGVALLVSVLISALWLRRIVRC